MPAGTNFQIPQQTVITSAPGQTQKSQADAQQQTKFVFNVDNDKTSQSLQLLFQLPSADGQQQQMKAPEGALKNLQNVAQTQTMDATGPAQPVQIPSFVNHQQAVLNFQLQQQQQQQQQSGIQMNQQVISNVTQQKAQQVPQFINKNYQQVQVATQTQMIGTQTQAPSENVQHPTTSNKSTNVSASMAKKSSSGDQKRKEKSRCGLRSAPSGQNQYQYDQQLQQYANIPGSTSTGTTTERAIEIDSETESNHDTALTLACAGGHEELVDLLLNRKANIEHRDKKGFTPLILAATAGHEKVVELLINNNADLEAQSERTKDTPLSLACSGGRYEVVELLLKYGANKEHRNVSDYTPLSLAASGGYVNIIKLLLTHGAEINSRTGSKLGISPLMLAAMNGHTAAVRLLLDMGSDINAQIETNRNTALTLACFQGRNEVVSLLLDRKANVEHRAKTGLTPLMEAASGGYIEVGRVLLDKGADVNAAPVPSSRDTALTIAADKGHLKFVELLLSRGASVEVKNKKGNSPLWLAANGGHLTVVEALYHAKADIDSQDNRKVSCLMAAFRKGHIKVVKWMVNHVTQFPSDQEMTRYISVVDKEVVEKCQECVKIIRAAKETQAAKANINASILLKELDMEKSREDARKAAAAKRRERKKRRKQEKKEAQRKLNGEDDKNNGKNSNQKGKGAKNEEPDSDETEEESNDEEEVEEIENQPAILLDKEEGDSGIDQGSCSSSDAKGVTISKIQIEQENSTQNAKNQKNQKRKKNQVEIAKPATGKSSTRSSSSPTPAAKTIETIKTREDIKRIRDQKNQRSADLTTKSIKPLEKENVAPKEPPAKVASSTRDAKNFENPRSQHRKSLVFGNSRSSAGADENDIERLIQLTAVQGSSKLKVTSPTKVSAQSGSSSASKPPREEEWKEVGRKPVSTSTTSTAPPAPSANEIGCKKIQVPLNAISRVIGRGGSNINAIRAATGAHIEVEKQGKTQGDRSITIKGVAEATKQAHNLISTLIKDPDADILSMLPRNNFQPVKSSSSTNVIPAPSVPPTSIAINNGTSVWEKSMNTFPTVQNPVKPASSFAAASKPVPSGIAKSVTPTQLNSKSQRSSVAKNLFAQPSNIMRPTPLSGKSSVQDNSKKGMVATNGPPSKPATAMTSSMQVLRNSIANASTASVLTSQAPAASSTTGTFASKLSGSSDGSAPNAGKSSTSSPTKQMSNGSNASSSSIPAPFTNSVSTSSALGGLVQTVADSFASTTPTTITRSITPIGPPTRNINASPHSSHIVNTLDLSTPYSTNTSSAHEMTHIQSKLGDLHMNDQRSEYSLFNNYIKWPSQDKSMDFGIPLKVSASSFIEEPRQVDASKAPGYRGASINSPVSSKTSSNSATPPSTTLAAQAPTSGSSVSQMQSTNNTFADANVIKPIGQGPIQPIGPVQRPGGGNNRMDMSFNRSQGFFDYNDQSSYGSMNNFMNQQPNVNASLSRLNPKASSFSTTSGQQPSANVQNQNKMNDHMYGSFMAQNNNFMKSPGSSNSSQLGFQRPNQQVPSSRWFPGGYGSFGGQENEYTGPSPTMSPNNNSHQAGNGPNDDSRKAVAPIGNERTAYKYYGGSGYGNQNLLDMDASAMMNNPSMAPGRNSYMDNKSQWHMPQQQSNNMPRGYDQPSEYQMQDIFPVSIIEK
jgi:ankyrin repeat domain-containing protein 17